MQDQLDMASVTNALKVSNQQKLSAPAFNPKSVDFKPFNPTSITAPIFKPTNAPSQLPAQGGLSAGLSSLSNINNDFTPSTPYVHKFRTEICKNFELHGKCKYGDEVSTSFFHFFKSFWFHTIFYSNYTWRDSYF